MLTTALPRTRALAPAAIDTATLPALPMDSDRVLVIRAASGDDRAFATLTDRYSRLLRAIASRILGGTSADVDDVVQETFVAAWLHLDSVIDGDTIAGWLATTVRRRSIDRLRSPASARRAELDEDLPSTEQDDPEAAARCTALAADVRRALATMPDLQRRCWELRQLHESSYSEIALDLGITPATVRGMLSRARLLMTSELAHWR